MTPQEFEELVAADFRAKGYDVDLRAGPGDWGVDIIATRGRERLGIQAKMYGGARPVNRRQVFELHGASRYLDCTGAVLASDGLINGDARDAAERLGIQIWRPPAPPRPTPPRALAPAPADRGKSGDLPPFDVVWERAVMPLSGKTLRLAAGGANRITQVDWGGVRRVSSTGRKSAIPIEPFMWAYDRIRDRGFVTRGEINEQFEGRYSSAVTAILAQVAELELIGPPATIRRRGPGVSK
jgi:restriction system protein